MLTTSLSSLIGRESWRCPHPNSGGNSSKVIEAAAHGVPVVTTCLVGKLLGWNHGIELLCADTPDEFAGECLRLYKDSELWATLRANALERVRREYSSFVFRETLAKAIFAPASCNGG